MLEILNNRTEHTHENEQFRRVIDIIEIAFNKLGYNGVLIGNPFNESYSRFRADAILYYNNGLILIDFKDYKGIIKLPPNENEFHSAKWHNENLKDRSRLEIKAGANFINPFRQLVSYRNAFRELVEKNKYLGGINPARVCIANIFSGPIEIHNEVPRNLPYYKLIQESELGNFIYDFASENTYKEDIAKILRSVFPAEKWIKNLRITIPEPIIEKQITEIDNDVQKNIVDFLKEENGGILVLESMNTEDRDSWLRFATNEAVNHNIPQVEKWSHSARISKKIQKRSNIETEGIYSIIYGGSDIEGQNENPDTEEQEEELLEVIPLKSSKDIDEKALIIITEAHLVSRSLSQSELLRFGSGRLLEDIVKFINPQSDRKIVFIGDPYSLTFGKDEDTALNLETLSELYDKEKIKHYRKPIENEATDGKEKLRIDLANSIEKFLFNDLSYSFDQTTLIDLKDDSQRIQNLYSWFAKPFLNEPDKAVLFYSKKDCLKTNKWIKKQCLKSGETLAINDLLIVNNNVSIPDDSGFQIPRRIINGMFFTVLDIKETQQEHIKIRQSQNPIVLSFSKINVKCLSLAGSPDTDIWILDNYFNSEDELTKEEQIAFRVFVNAKINNEKRKQKFEDSQDYKQLLQDKQYNDLSNEEKDAIKILVKNYNLLKEKKEKIETSRNARNLLSSYYKRYSKKLFFQIKDSDPFVNAVFVKYGWAITVHKAIGSNYNEVIIKGHRKENDGITNDSYFRWLYSGVTAGKTVNIISPQIINPFMNCVFEDNSTNGVTIKSKQFLIFEDYKVEARFVEKIQSIDNKNVVGAICELSKLLEQNGYLLESSKKFTEYLTKVHYSIPQNENQQLILNIDNKGSKDNFAVGNIRIEKLNGADETIVKKCIENCLSQKQNVSSITDDKPESPTDFREEIYSDWIQNCENKNITLKIIQSHNNQDIFRATCENDNLIFKVWYGTSEQSKSKGFFSKIEVLKKSSETILEKVKGIIYGF
ncbi:Uncharacterised protein [Chryseobacterium nakagawai]|uniref:NERD domain-containing protein n=1 Tax=Chryseobacterium nakagawai TaxID=1241982 RepID=A0AAD1DTA6_CHRNA|nr:hypothetical protein [Chryseobacterium nakagawai]AZA93636.1 hypothetical protein EG343_25030 [Chryseobacterium nakagawai]VEH20340.1 Uncharacterised protein [Chryseobacterium nakagawai]